MSESRPNETPNEAGSVAEIESALRRFVAERSDGSLTVDAIDPTLHLFDTGYLDSMNSLALLDFVEQRYGVEIPEVELVGGLSTLATLAAFIDRTAARPGSTGR